ncbi:MAG: hypothetical protein ACOYT4_00470 [Nanoarchaeota archaeon]
MAIFFLDLEINFEGEPVQLHFDVTNKAVVSARDVTLEYNYARAKEDPTYISGQIISHEKYLGMVREKLFMLYSDFEKISRQERTLEKLIEIAPQEIVSAAFKCSKIVLNPVAWKRGFKSSKHLLESEIQKEELRIKTYKYCRGFSDYGQKFIDNLDGIDASLDDLSKWKKILERLSDLYSNAINISFKKIEMSKMWL